MTSKKTIALVALIAMVTSIIGGFVVYAFASANLDIQGSADFQPESWNVRFRPASLQSETAGVGTQIATQPVLSDTMISDFRIILTQPGNSATFTFWIENTASLDAILSTYSPGSPECEGTGSTAAADETLVCGPNLTYTFRYIGGNLSENGLTMNAPVALNDVLKSETAVQVELKLAFSSSATIADLPTNTVTISNLGKTLIYTVNQ